MVCPPCAARPAQWGDGSLVPPSGEMTSSFEIRPDSRPGINAPNGPVPERRRPRRRLRWLLALLTVLAAVALALLLTRGSSNQLFAPSSVWNVPVPRDAQLDPNSATYVSELLQQVSHYGPWFNTSQYSVPVYTVGPNQPTVPVALDPAAGNQPDLVRDWSAVPVPSNAQPASGSDGSLVVWQPSTDKMWEFWQMRREGGSWHARWGGYMGSVSQNPGYYTPHTDWGSSATSLPAIAGLVRIDELRSGHIDHALALGVADASSLVYSSPAERTDGNVSDPRAIPEGAHFRLDPSLDLAKLHLPRFTRMLAEAAQRYGLIVHDRASLVVMWGEDPTSYRNDPYGGAKGFFGDQSITTLMKDFPWSHLQALRTSLHRVKP
jgi:hypothetical protein